MLLRSGLFIRIFLITILALLSFIAVFFLVFRSSVIFPAGLERLAEPLTKVVSQLEAGGAPNEDAVLTLFASPTRVAEVHSGFPEGALEREEYTQRLLRSSLETQAVLSDRGVRFRYLKSRRTMDHLSASTRERFPAVTALEVSTALQDGRVLIVLFSPAAIFVDSPQLMGLLYALASLIIATAAAVGIKLTLRPLDELELAAKRFGATIDPEPVNERGPPEIRRLARALNRTQDQVRLLISERTRMMSALAHDVLTSMTRLRLRIAAPERPDVEALTADINELEALIDDMLIYAKSGEPNQGVELIDLLDFTRSYAADAPIPLSLDIDARDQQWFIAADPLAIKRVLNNLVDNAVHYGGSANVVCIQTEHALLIHIDDNGPGIPEDQLTKVLEPFYRLETSRSRSTGGSGMGLGIADSLMRALGGRVELKNKEPSGLRATLVFPSALQILS